MLLCNSFIKERTNDCSRLQFLHSVIFCHPLVLLIVWVKNHNNDTAVVDIGLCNVRTHAESF